MLISDPFLHLCRHIWLVISGKASLLNTIAQKFCIDDTALICHPCRRPVKGDLVCFIDFGSG